MSASAVVLGGTIVLVLTVAFVLTPVFVLILAFVGVFVFVALFVFILFVTGALNVDGIPAFVFVFAFIAVVILFTAVFTLFVFDFGVLLSISTAGVMGLMVMYNQNPAAATPPRTIIVIALITIFARPESFSLPNSF